MSAAKRAAVVQHPPVVLRVVRAGGSEVTPLADEVSALAELMAAIYGGSTLAWAIVGTAKHGSVDAALSDAWKREAQVGTLLDALCRAHGARRPSDPRYDRGKRALIRARKRCDAPAETHDYQPCAKCSDAIRKACDCPTWAELTRAA